MAGMSKLSARKGLFVDSSPPTSPGVPHRSHTSDNNELIDPRLLDADNLDGALMDPHGDQDEPMDEEFDEALWQGEVSSHTQVHIALLTIHRAATMISSSLTVLPLASAIVMMMTTMVSSTTTAPMVARAKSVRVRTLSLQTFPTRPSKSRMMAHSSLMTSAFSRHRLSAPLACSVAVMDRQKETRLLPMTSLSLTSWTRTINS